MKDIVNKKARIRNTNKKQPFLYGQIKKLNSRMVAWVKAPNTHFGEDNIPNNVKNGCDNDTREQRLPAFYIVHPMVEAVKKRN